MKKVVKIIVAAVLFVFAVLFLLVEKGVMLAEIGEFINGGTFFAKAVKVFDTIAIAACLILIADLIVEFGNKETKPTLKTVSLLLGNILKYAAIIGALLSFLSLIGVDTSALVTASGVLALIVGLGCQTLVSDIVAGIFLIFEGDVKVGDIIVVNGWRGTVRQIGLRRTKIEDSVGNVNIVNNSSITNFINNTKELSYAICCVGIEYNESIERVEAILSEHLHEFKEAIPAIVEGPFYKGVQELGESSVSIKFIAKCYEDDKFQVERDINRQIKLLFDKYNINIPFNQIVVNYRDENEEQTVATRKEVKKAEAFVQEQKELSGNIEEQNQ